MRRMHSIVLLVALVALTPVLVGCESFDNEKFDVLGLNDKKKLKGERKELFPEGVPGVTQGLPPEYLNKPPRPAVAQKPATEQTPAAPADANTVDGAPYPEVSAPNDEAAAPNAEAAAPDAEAAAPNAEAAAPAQPSKTAAVEPVEEPEPKAKPKRKPKPRTAARAATQVTVQPAAQKQNGGRQQPSPWPDQKQAQSPWPAQGQSESTSSPWPSAPPPGTFSR